MKALEFGDMIFYVIISLILILLFWLRFLEPAIGLWGAWLVWFAFAVYLVRCHVKARRRTRIEDNKERE